MRKGTLVLSVLLASFAAAAQTTPQPTRVFTHADILRGTNSPERSWWDIQRYDITVKPDYLTKTTTGNDLITYKVVSDRQPGMQLDLQEPLHIDSIRCNGAGNLPMDKGFARTSVDDGHLPGHGCFPLVPLQGLPG